MKTPGEEMEGEAEERVKRKEEEEEGGHEKQGEENKEEEPTKFECFCGCECKKTMSGKVHFKSQALFIYSASVRCHGDQLTLLIIAGGKKGGKKGLH